MSDKDNKLPPKVEKFIKAASAQLGEQATLVKRAEDAEGQVAELTKAAADTSVVDEAITKLASDTADTLLADGVISAEHRAKFASDLVDPNKAHTLLRNLGKKVVAAEAHAKAPAMGGPVDSQVKSASDEGGESAHDRFASRVRQVSGK